MQPVATPEYSSGMSPNAPKTPPRQIRIGDEWYDFDKAAKSLGTERAAVIRDFIAWYLRQPGAKLPARPDRDAWKSSTVDHREERSTES